MNKNVHRFTRRSIQGDYFSTPPYAELEAMNFIISTNTSVSNLRLAGVKRGFFSHIIIDEAAQATECELAIPLSLAEKTTKVCMVGDHRQISPRVYLPDIKLYQPARRMFQQSMLKRLSTLPIYAAGKEGAVCHLQLAEVYRCHPEITHMLDVFYQPEITLKSVAPENSQTEFPALLKRSNKRVFKVNCFSGQEKVNEETGLPENEREARAVADVVADVLEDRCITQKQICVITPSFAQTKIVRRVLREKNLFEVEVHNLDNIQGLEYICSSVIFVSLFCFLSFLSIFSFRGFTSRIPINMCFILRDNYFIFCAF